MNNATQRAILFAAFSAIMYFLGTNKEVGGFVQNMQQVTQMSLEPTYHLPKKTLFEQEAETYRTVQPGTINVEYGQFSKREFK